MAGATTLLRFFPGALLLAAGVLVTACGSTTPERRAALAERRLRLSALVVDDPAGERRIRASACGVDPSRCNDLRVFVLKGDVPVADYRPGAILRISAGLLARAQDDAALAFVIAHELAHEVLGHFDRSIARIAREIAADAHARDALAARGIPLAPALTLLEGLRDEAGRNPDADPAGLAELDARLAALREPR